MPLAVTAQSVIALMEEHHILDTQEPVLPDSDLVALGLDSLATMQLLLHLETAFGISLAPALVKRENFATPAAVAELVNRASGE